MKRTKMSRDELVALFPEPQPTPDYRRSSHATRKNHIHVVNAVWLPGRPAIRPALYRHLHRGKSK